MAKTGVGSGRNSESIQKGLPKPIGGGIKHPVSETGPSLIKFFRKLAGNHGTHVKVPGK